MESNSSVIEPLPLAISVSKSADESHDDHSEDFSGDNYIPPEAKDPSISPRDRLSYQDDKRLLKELRRFQSETPCVSKLVYLMQMAILRSKPENIVLFLCEEFFSERNQMQLRKELGIKETNNN